MDEDISPNGLTRLMNMQPTGCPAKSVRILHRTPSADRVAAFDRRTSAEATGQKSCLRIAGPRRLGIAHPATNRLALETQQDLRRFQEQAPQCRPRWKPFAEYSAN